jgi:hypothetical protein
LTRRSGAGTLIENIGTFLFSGVCKLKITGGIEEGYDVIVSGRREFWAHGAEAFPKLYLNRKRLLKQEKIMAKVQIIETSCNR